MTRVLSLRGQALHDAFRELLGEHGRIAIAGGPKVGKTRICRRCVDDRPVFGTDTYKGLPWEDQPASILGMCEGVPRFVVEGVQTARALRKGLQVDCIVYLTKPWIERLPGQERMAKGVATIMRNFIELTPDHPPIVQLT